MGRTQRTLYLKDEDLAAWDRIKVKAMIQRRHLSDIIMDAVKLSLQGDKP